MLKTKIFYGWWVVAGSIVGASVGSAQFAFGSLGVFMSPLGAEFGWSRTEMSFALTMFTVSQGLAVSLVGYLIDRYGVRRVLLPSLIVYAILLSGIPLLVGKLWHLLLMFFLIGFLATGTNSISYMRIVSAWFDRRRGLALGVTMAGGGLGFFYVPPFVQYLIEAFGWRAGYYGLVALVILAMPVIYLFLRDSPLDLGLTPDGIAAEKSDVDRRAQFGLLRAEAVKQGSFWKLIVIFALLAFCLFGVLPHLFPMLMDRGMPGSQAAIAASTMGITMIVARWGIGYLIDRFFAPYVAFPCFLLSALGFAMLATGATGWPVFVAAAFLGISAGAEFDLLAFLTSRYFGLRNFGGIYAYLFIAFLIGASLGPLTYGAVYEHTGSYMWILSACTILTVVAGLIMLTLPRYPKVE